MSTASERLILVTGASGYIGGRLVQLLRERAKRLRLFCRNPDFVRDRLGTDLEIVKGDALDPLAVEQALKGVDTAFYLVHSLGSKQGFETVDREAARIFGAAARRQGVRRIIYLGGLGHGAGLSQHLRSRHEVGEILRSAGVQTIEFRASIVIGSGSLSFAMIRALVHRLPLLITPRWVDVLAQPIAIRDLLEYLAEAIELPLEGSRVFEIGGADRASYRDIILEYARHKQFKPIILRVPVLTPYLSSLWLGLVTPLYARVGRKLIDSVRNETVVRDNSALTVFSVKPMGLSEAIERAIAREENRLAQTRWSDALSSAGTDPRPREVVFGSRIFDSRSVEVKCSPAQAFVPVRRIGGETGWYAVNWLWRFRGFIDLLCGGVGLRRGRRHPEVLHPGDTVDWWRVESIQENSLLRLIAEMKVPGRAWLQFEVEPSAAGALIRQTAIFDPAGFWGRLYWYMLYPLHVIVFKGMLRGIARAAERATVQ